MLPHDQEGGPVAEELGSPPWSTLLAVLSVSATDFGLSSLA